MDLLSNILRVFRVNAAVVQRGQCQGQSMLKVPVAGRAVFHMVSHGRCHLHIENQQTPIVLGCGDVMLMPRDLPHYFKDAGDGAGAGIVCAYFQFERGMRNPILDALPDGVLLQRGQDRAQALTSLLELLLEEAAADRPGSEAVLGRLSDAVFIYMIRHHLATNPQQTGMLAALQDRYLGEALRRLHEAPQSRWTVDTLAADVGLSRSALAKRFQEIMGETPMDYLMRWRMQLAYSWLREEDAALLDVAQRCGYQSESAFAKTFKRHFGFGPGQARRGRAPKIEQAV
ncbi:MAG: AraC family transcriptional regulator [Gammaproteobacteria bacterium]|nr:AraC family transcriptional regulator [Gammaproteobacteria bacterium]